MELLRRALLLTGLSALAVVLSGLFFRLLQRAFVSLLSWIIGPRAAAAVINALTFPGTVHHELSHALAGVLTGARVTAIRLLPSGNELGSVSMIPPRGVLAGSLSRTFSALSPVYLGCLSLSILYSRVLPLCTTVFPLILFWHLFVSILLHMDLSGADIRAAAKGAPVCLALLFVLFLVLLYFFPDLPGTLSDSLLSVLRAHRPVQEF